MRIKESVPDTLAWVPMFLGLIGGLWIGVHLPDPFGRIAFAVVFLSCAAFGVYIMEPSDP